MVTIYLVDDDYLILDELKNLINYASIGYKIIGMNTNSLKAKEEIIELKPDVIITDIQMDMLDGINLTESLLEECPKSYFIFVSGYDKFDYAIEAIRLGATRFLRKPIKEKELISCLHDIKTKINDEFSNRVQIAMNDDAENMEKIFTNSHLLKNSKYRIICLNGYNYLTIIDDIKKSSSEVINIYGDANIGLFIAFDVDYKKILDLKRKYENISIGISLEKEANDYKNISDITRKTRISSKQKFITGKSEFVLYDEKVPYFLIDEINAINQVTVLEDKVYNLKKNLIDNHINVCFLQKIYQCIFLAMVRLKIIELGDEYDVSVIDTYDSIDSLIDDLKGYFISSDNDDNNEIIINEVKKEIENSLNKKLSMTYIAKKYGYNISYFSQLFKKVVGMSFVEYFISLKIDRAKYLIANTNELFQNIALEVGYDDYYHFSKMFKKYTSYSPTEYKTLFKK